MHIHTPHHRVVLTPPSGVLLAEDILHIKTTGSLLVHYMAKSRLHHSTNCRERQEEERCVCVPRRRGIKGGAWGVEKERDGGKN